MLFPNAEAASRDTTVALRDHVTGDSYDIENKPCLIRVSTYPRRNALISANHFGFSSSSFHCIGMVVGLGIQHLRQLAPLDMDFLKKPDFSMKSSSHEHCI